MYFYLLSIPLVAWIGSQIAGRSGREAFWSAWWVALLLCPFWVGIQIGFLTVDLRAVAMAMAVVGLIASPGAGGMGFGRPVLADLLEVLLVSGHIVSEYQVGRFSPMSAPELLRIWFLPYVVGRLFLRTADDIPEATRRFAKVCLIACIYAMTESVLKFNPINRLLGKTYGLLEQGEGYRMGLKRAQGAQEHPIFMGLVLVLILPWAFEASRMARSNLGPRWWRALPWLVGGALFGTVSRGPQLSALMTTYIAIFLRNPALRVRLALLGVAIGLSAYAAKEVILDVSAKISKESEEPVRIIVINGEEEEYTGTRHRILLFKAYAEYIDNAGLWGYGNAMRAVELEESLAMRFGSIDSAYVMLHLQRGHSGVFPFVGLTVVTLFNLLRVAWSAKTAQAPLAAGLFSAMLMLVVTLFTSWFSPDFGAAFLFTAGVSARLPGLTSRPESDPDRELSGPPVASPLPRFVLVAGHPSERTGERSS